MYYAQNYDNQDGWEHEGEITGINHIGKQNTSGKYIKNNLFGFIRFFLRSCGANEEKGKQRNDHEKIESKMTYKHPMGIKSVE